MSITLAERWQPPARLDEREDRERLVRGMVDESLLCERRDDHCWDPEPRSPAVDDRRRHVIPPATVLVVGDDDHGMRPDGAILYGLDQLGYLLLAGDERRVARVLVLVADRLDEGDGREAPRGQVAKEVRLILEVARPLGCAGRVPGEVDEGLVVELKQRVWMAGLRIVPAASVPCP